MSLAPLEPEPEPELTLGAPLVLPLGPATTDLGARGTSLAGSTEGAAGPVLERRACRD